MSTQTQQQQQQQQQQPAVELNMDELYPGERAATPDVQSNMPPGSSRGQPLQQRQQVCQQRRSVDITPSRISPDLPPSRSRSRARGGPRDAGAVFLPEFQPRGISTPRKARRRQQRAVNMDQLKAGKGQGTLTPSSIAAAAAAREEDLEGSLRTRVLGSQAGSTIGSGATSPMLRPASRAGGISILRQQLEALNLERQPSSASMRNSESIFGAGAAAGGSASPSTGEDDISEVGYDSDPTEMTSYEYSISFENDFVSPEARLAENEDAATSPATPFLDKMHRKMSAADFEPLTCLGQGTFGTVHLVRQTSSGRLYAQKMFRKASLTLHKSMIEQTRTERAILESINRHPFLVKLFYAFQDHERLYLILEYAQGGELFTHLAAEKMFPENTASFYMAELVLALEHLHHSVGVVYRDLKPENCLLDADGHLLLTDFGLSKISEVPGEGGADSLRCSSILGTVDYMAPEVIMGQFYHAPVDWWSLGALGFDLLAGKPPFAAANHKKTQDKILRAKPVFPYFFSADARDLLTRLLRKEPAKRLGGKGRKDVATIKAHRFFRKIDWRRLERRELEPPIQPLITDPALAENFATEFTDMPLSPTLNSGWDLPEAQDVVRRVEMGDGSGREKNGIGVVGILGADDAAMGGEGVDINNGGNGASGKDDAEHPFRGFSFVAPRSFLEQEHMQRLKELGQMEVDDDGDE